MHDGTRHRHVTTGLGETRPDAASNLGNREHQTDRCNTALNIIAFQVNW